MDWIPPLVITSLVPYIVIPLIMWGIYERRDYLEDKIYSYHLIQIGLIFIVLSLTFEFAWHHFIHNWDYETDSHILNGLFYVSMNFGFGCMSVGLLREKYTDTVVLLSLVAAPIAYFAFQIKEVVWVTQLALLLILTARGYIVLKDKRVILFPVFSFVANMFFSTFLFMTGHPIYHILHVLLGTLLGFAIFGYLFWDNPRHIERKEKE